MNVLVTHGTRKPEGVCSWSAISHSGCPSCSTEQVHVAFVDALDPTPAQLLSPSAIVVPAFLSRRHHVNTDIAAHIAASGHAGVVLTPPLGPDPQMVRVLADGLVESGCRLGALRDLHTAAA